MQVGPYGRMQFCGEEEGAGLVLRKPVQGQVFGCKSYRYIRIVAG